MIVNRTMPAVAVALVLVAGAGGARADAPKKPKFASLDDFLKCADQAWDGVDCIEALNVYVKAHPAQAFDAGKAVTTKLNHSAALPFFDKALAAKTDKARCADERLASAVLSGLGLPKDQALAATARAILGRKCWNEMGGAVVKAFEKDPGGYLNENLCPLLVEKKQTSAACAPAAEAPAPPAPSAAERWVPLDPRKIDVEAPAKVYVGLDGRRITMVKVKGEADAYLVKFEGFRGPWNGKVIAHREVRAGDGFDYWTLVGGAQWNAVVARKVWGGSMGYEVYPQGDEGPFPVGYSEKDSKAADPKAILRELGK